MNQKTITRDETTFDLFKTLTVVQNEKILSSIFVDEYGPDYKDHFQLIQTDMMNEEAQDLLRRIHDTFILNDKKLLDKYRRIQAPIAAQKEIEDEPTEPAPAEQHSTISITTEVKPLIKSRAPKYTKVKRRLTLKDIENNAKERGGEYTENERALISGAELKNICVRLHNKGKQGLFTDEEARIVIGTIDTVKKKLLPILNKK